MTKNKLIKQFSKSAALLATCLPLATGTVQTFAEESQPAPSAVTANTEVPVSAKGTISDINPTQKGASTYTGSFSLDMTLPDNIAAGSVINFSTENLPYLFANNSVTSVDVKVENTVIGKLSVVSATDYAVKQQDTKTTLDQKKADNIKAGSAIYNYKLTFNDKASGFSGKSVSFGVNSKLIVATPVARDINSKAKIIVSGKEVVAKEFILNKQSQNKPSGDSIVDFSTNTRLLISPDGQSKAYLGLLFVPLDHNYEAGSRLTVNLQPDSMIKFFKESDKNKDITVHPRFDENTFVNDNGVYLPESNPVRLNVVSVSDNKLVLEVASGTLKQYTQYSINPDNVGVNYKLTTHSTGKLNNEGTKFGTETVTSSITDKAGVSYKTQDNSLDISVIGAKLTATGVQKIVEQPEKPVTPPTPEEKIEYKTNWVEEGTNKPLKPSVTGSKIEEAGNISGYTLVETKQGPGKNETTYVFKKQEYKLVTRWLEEGTDKELKSPVTDSTTKEAGKVSGYTFVKSKTDLDGNVTHYFKKNSEIKIITTRFIEEGSGKELKDPIKGDKGEDPGKVPGYSFVRTEIDPKTGDVTHYFKESIVTTRFVDENGKELLKSVTDRITKDPEKIEGYLFVKSVVDPETGNVTHHYKVISYTTKWVDEETGKELKEKVTDKSTKEAGTISGYNFVKTEKDSKTGDLTHYFKKLPTTPTPKKDIQTGVSVGKVLLPGIGLLSVGGLLTGLFVYKKKNNKK